MTKGRLSVAMIHEVFFGEGAGERLDTMLARGREAGAELALLPELPFDPWIPATQNVTDGDAEQSGGPRHRLIRTAAQQAGISVLGGAIVDDGGVRRNRALLADAGGEIISAYDKLHLPYEEGFWERAHYEPGKGLTAPCDRLGLRLGLQICSDMQRPQMVTALAAMGAEAILAPRATPSSSHERWRTVLRAAAVASACYVVSINRPGSPSLAIAPDGEVLEETSAPLTVVTLERTAIEAARADYPGYLDVRAGLYAETWAALE